MTPSRRAFLLPDGRLIACFHTIWPMEPDGRWCVILDHGGPMDPKDADRHPRPNPRPNPRSDQRPDQRACR